MTATVRLGRALSFAWALLAAGGAAVAQSDATDDGRALILVLAVVAVTSALGAGWLLGRGRTRGGGAALLVAGLCAPTFGLAALNLVPIVVGGVLAVRAAPASGG